MWSKSLGFIPDKAELAAMREKYKPGTRVELIQMDDPQAPAPGTRGTVVGVDDVGSVMCHWDNGSGLSLAYHQDIFKVVDEK